MKARIFLKLLMAAFLLLVLLLGAASEVDFVYKGF
jgi:hypothetical protein